MRILTTAIAVSLLCAAPAFAKSDGVIIPKSSAYAKAIGTSPGEIAATCAKIIADQNKSKVAMGDAGHLLFHGELMGQHCVQVDYVKALTLVKEGGDTVDYNAFVKILQQRAASGNPLAISALDKLHLAH